MYTKVITPETHKLADLYLALDNPFSTFLAGYVDDPWRSSLIDIVENNLKELASKQYSVFSRYLSSSVFANNDNNHKQFIYFMDPIVTDYNRSDNGSLSNLQRWELVGIENARVIIFYLKGENRGDCQWSLFELGYRLGLNSYRKNSILIYCDSNFHLKSRIETISDQYRIPLFSKFDNLVEYYLSIILNKMELLSLDVSNVS